MVYSKPAFGGAGQVLRHCARYPHRVAIGNPHPSPYGRKLDVRGSFVGPTGRKAELISNWIILVGTDTPRFVTASPGMRFKQPDTVVLDRDLPGQGLGRGDLGAVVEVYEPNGLAVAFVTASGRTEAVVTLRVADVRAVEDGDLSAVRPFDGQRGCMQSRSTLAAEGERRRADG